MSAQETGRTRTAIAIVCVLATNESIAIGDLELDAPRRMPAARHHQHTRMPDSCASIGISRKGKSSDGPVLGETGNRERTVRRAVHRLVHGPANLIRRHMAASPRALRKRTLRHTKGSFTGHGRSKGYFELANHGTIF